MHESNNRVFMFQRSSRRNAFWYISEVGDLNGLVDDDVNVDRARRDLYRVNSYENLPPHQGWSIQRAGRQPAPLLSLENNLDEPAVAETPNVAIVVSSAGRPEANGRYERSPWMYECAPVFTHETNRNLMMFRYRRPNWHNVYWYITEVNSLRRFLSHDLQHGDYHDFYRVMSPARLPPLEGWGPASRLAPRDPAPNLRLLDMRFGVALNE